MMQATLRTHPEVLEQLQVASWQRLLRVVVFFWNAVQSRLSISAGPVQVRRSRKTSAGAKGSTYLKYTNPSKKDEPPHIRSGHGRGNTVYNLDEKAGTGRVGVVRMNPFTYMLFHELRDRSFLLSTLELVRSQLQVLARG
jgi:hypothetical protein